MDKDLKSMVANIANKQKQEIDQQKRRFDYLKREIEHVGAISKETQATVSGFQQEIEKTSWQSKGNKKDIKTVLELLSEVDDKQTKNLTKTDEIKLTLPGFAEKIVEHDDKITSIEKGVKKIKKYLKIA